MSFKVNVYDPKAQAYASRISTAEWESHKNVISDLHSAKTPRKVMLKRLKDDHNFTPTLGQLQAKCKEWNLKVYSKELSKTPETTLKASRSPVKRTVSSDPAFHLVTGSGFVQEWSEDYRIHPLALQSLGDTTLPPTGPLANTVDSHWPLPDDSAGCDAMLQAAHYYLSVNAFQQAFSIYRAVYLFQRKQLSLCHPDLIRTVLFSACSAVTEHQRNIVHSVLGEIGVSAELENVDALYVECLQSASLSMMSAASCDIEDHEQAKARATAYLYIMNTGNRKIIMDSSSCDRQLMLYQFEHSLLMQEHKSKILQHLLTWCELALDRLHRDIDDIFVGVSSCEDEYHHRIAQVLSGHLLSQWHRETDEHDDERTHLLNNFQTEESLALHFDHTTTQTLVALAFMIVDAVRHDPLSQRINRTSNDTSCMWFLDAAKLFKRGTKMLVKLDERSRCAVFAESYLERFYTSVSYRRKAYHWAAQLPAIVDTVGMSLAQQITLQPYLDSIEEPPILHIPEEPLYDLSNVVEMLDLSPPDLTAGENATEAFLQNFSIPDFQPPDFQPGSFEMGSQPPDLQAPMAHVPPTVDSDSNSIASFINTYRRTLKTTFGVKSGKSTPGDLMSLTSSAEFKLGAGHVFPASETGSCWLIVDSST